MGVSSPATFGSGCSNRVSDRRNHFWAVHQLCEIDRIQSLVIAQAWIGACVQQDLD